MSDAGQQKAGADRPGAERGMLVVSAHAGDFVWRAAGAIAGAVRRGEPVTIVCLSFRLALCPLRIALESARGA